MANEGQGTWDENYRSVYDRLNRLERELGEVRHKANSNTQIITGHISLCELRDRQAEQLKESHDRVHQDSARQRVDDLKEIKQARLDDIGVINKAIMEVRSVVTKKTGAQDRLIQAALYGYAGFVSLALFWALGKLLHLTG